jgi:hypothetical protein
MNSEELKIVIKAVTDQFEKELSAVKKELKDVEKQGKSIEGLKDSFSKVAKGVAAATVAVTGLVAGISKLGSESVNLQKIYGRLESGFAATGQSAEQAHSVFKGFYRFLGEEDTALEAANLLAQLTGELPKQEEWLKALQGAWASLPFSTTTESLMESINATVKAGEVEGQLADALDWVGVRADDVNAKLATLNSETEREAYLRGLMIDLYGGSAEAYERANGHIMAYYESQANLNYILASLSKTLTPVLTEMNNMAATLLQVLAPAIQFVCQVIVVFIGWIVKAASAISQFFGGSKIEIGGVADSMGKFANYTNGATGGMNKLGKEFDKNNKKAKELKRLTMGFDELNVVNPASSASSGGSAGAGGVDAGNLKFSGIDLSGVDMSAMDFGLGDFYDGLDEVEERIESIITLATIAGAAFATWKVINLIQDPEKSLGASLQKIGGYALIIAGALLTIQGYSDAWVNGLDWGNFATVIGGLAAVVGGVYLAFGPLAASIAGVAAGVALLVLGVKDFIDNGPSVQNTIMIIGGAIAIAVGLATGGVSVLVSAIVGVVAAVGAFTAAIILEEPAIMSVKDAEEQLAEAKQATADARMANINAIDAAEQAQKRLEEAEKKAGITGAELNKQVEDGTLKYEDMTDAQKEAYKAYLDNEKKQKDLEESTKALTEAKHNETLASFDHQLALAKESGNYDDFKKSVVDAYEAGEISADEARDMIEKSMSEMSDASQQTFMEDLPGDLKDGMDPHKYESTGTKMKKWFSNLWSSIKKTFSDAASAVANAVSSAFKKALNWVLEKAIGIINGFISGINFAIGIINKIPGVSISKLSKLDVPELATGGIVSGDTLARIGEGGKKEAVLPLEQNTEWMDLLADRINQRGGTPSKIVLMLDKKELGWANINSINDITQQTGTLQLTLA